MREKIWYELVHAKFGEIYLAKYISQQKSFRKWFKILTLIFSTSGILGWTIWEYAPIIACGLIGITQLINLIENQLFFTDEEFDNVSNLRIKYINYFNKLEKLWVNYKLNKFNDDEAADHFFKLREIGADIEVSDNKLHIKEKDTLFNKADKQTREYFSQYHPTKV
jgi:hypothetical protein